MFEQYSKYLEEILKNQTELEFRATQQNDIQAQLKLAALDNFFGLTESAIKLVYKSS